MFEGLEIFQMAQQMARHAAVQQGVTSRNVAHADTPDYRAREVAAFAESYATPSEQPLRRTRAEHFGGDAVQGFPVRIARSPQTANPNGNTVSLELEMQRATEARMQHDQALSIYRSATNLWRTSLGR